MLIEYLKKVCEIEKNKFLLQQMLRNEEDKVCTGIPSGKCFGYC